MNAATDVGVDQGHGALGFRASSRRRCRQRRTTVVGVGDAVAVVVVLEGDPQVGVRDVEEHVADRLDLDPRVRRCVFGRVTVCEPSFGVAPASTSGKVSPSSRESRIVTWAASIGGAAVPAGSQLTGSWLPPTTVARERLRGDPERARRGHDLDRGVGRADAAGDRVAVARGEPEVHRAVMRRPRPSPRSAGTPSSSRRRRAAPGPRGGGGGQLPVAAFVFPATICAMSGKTRVGSGPAAFSPGDGDIRVPSGSTIAAVPNWRNSGPLRFVLLASRVPLPAPMSFCSQV